MVILPSGWKAIFPDILIKTKGVGKVRIYLLDPGIVLQEILVR